MKRAAIFMMFDDKGIIYDYVKYLLRELKENVEELYVVCNGYLREDSRETLLSFTSHVYNRPNIGFDAAAWRAGILEYCGYGHICDFDELLLVNDSFFGPFYPLNNILTKMERKDIDFWGITAHGEANGNVGKNPYGYRPRYIQTYFIAVRKNLLANRAFKEYWEAMPDYVEFEDVVENFSSTFTKHFENLGFSYSVYSDTADLESTDRKKNLSHHMFNTYEMVAYRNLPIIKRKTFTISKDLQLRYGEANNLSMALNWIESNTNYDVGMIWQYLLAKYHMVDLQFALNLYYVLPRNFCGACADAAKNSAIIAHLFYNDLFERYCMMLEESPEEIDIYITTNSEDKKQDLEKRMSSSRHKVKVILAKNHGRELSALLVACRGIPQKYKYLCFIHDKKSSQKEFSTIGSAFSEHINASLLASKDYVFNVLVTFEQHKRLGLLVPSIIYWGSYFSSYCNLWTCCYEQTKEILDRINVTSVIDKKHPPVSIGSAFWCRTSALFPLFNEEWEYDDFPMEPMPDDGTISHGLERVFSFVAQSCGYYTANVMTTDIASTEIANFRYMARRMISATLHLVVIGRSNFFSYVRALERKSQKWESKYQGISVEQASVQYFAALSKHPLKYKIIYTSKNVIKKFLPSKVWVYLKSKFYGVRRSR